jgi:REP element-mobilizing transposase RayT
MPQSLSKVYLHIVFSTKDRKPAIFKKAKPQLQACLIELAANSLGTFTEEIFANPDHIHWLCVPPQTLTIAQLIQKVKILISSKMKEIAHLDFARQKGYGAFSVSQSKVDVVKKYIQNQEEHHQKLSFQNEYRRFLQEYEIEFDEKYVWD